MNNTRALVVHIIPEDGVGGVEAAARSLEAYNHPNLRVLYMAGPLVGAPTAIHEAISPRVNVNSPVAYVRALKRVLQLRPQLLVCSLWRGTLLGILVKLLAPRTKLVVMIHAITVAHAADKWVTWIGSRLAAQLWCDSEASFAVMKERYRNPGRVISFRVTTESALTVRRNPLDFVFWGRHVHFKDIPRAVRLFNAVLTRRPDARFFIYGAEGPATPAISEAIRGSVDPSAIKLLGAKAPGEYPSLISHCTFFLMTSKHEGMAVAVVEAMQLGLVPVVTPVGEIGNYCIDGTNSIVVDDDEEAAVRVIRLVERQSDLQSMSEAAIKRWRDIPLYSDDFKCAYSDLLGVRVAS